MRRFEWKSEPPAECPFPQSESLSRIIFTGQSSDYYVADTWYPSWADDGNLYSGYTDGMVDSIFSCSDAAALSTIPATKNYPTASTGNGVLIGNDPLHLQIRSLGVQFANPAPYGGRYPSGGLVHNGVWYYGTYCLGPFGQTKVGSMVYNWPHLGPFVGFRVSKDYGRTWTDCPHTPEAPLFNENGMCGYPVKIGAPHFVDFGKNMEHSPDGKAYLVAHGSDLKFYPVGFERFAHNSWITGDQVYLLRVVPSPETINNPNAYEFFAGREKDGTPVWSNDFSAIQPLLEWEGSMGCVTVTYNAPLKKYLMAVTDGGNTCAKMHTYILESSALTGEWKLVTYMKNFGEQAYFVNFPTKFISDDGKTVRICYSGNFAVTWNGEAIQENPPGSHYGLVLQEIELS